MIKSTHNHEFERNSYINWKWTFFNIPYFFFYSANPQVAEKTKTNMIPVKVYVFKYTLTENHTSELLSHLVGENETQHVWVK